MEVNVIPQCGELIGGHHNPHCELKAPSPLDKHEMESGIVWARGSGGRYRRVRRTRSASSRMVYRLGANRNKIWRPMQNLIKQNAPLPAWVLAVGFQ
jgi:hypothetical protein